ncbi:MAG TPA: trehalose-phosphatase [Gemmatimonadaceae bacterium]|nr:trehalose-phosphatase [Gemmatimonadaceae bacterium]
MTSPFFPVTPELTERLDGSPLIIMLDVDGTLAPITSRPDEATVPPETRRIVAALAARDSVHVVLVSGRAASVARKMVGVANVWTIGNHGYEISGPDGEELVDPQVAGYRPLMAQAARKLMTQVAHVPGVIFEDKTWTHSIHYRLAEPGVVPRLRAAVEETGRHLGLRITEGKLVLEVRPPLRVDKGTSVLTLAQRLDGFRDGASIIFIGDDRTDEDAFRALRARTNRAVAVRVTHGDDTPTAAEFTATDTPEVREILQWLLAPRDFRKKESA